MQILPYLEEQVRYDAINHDINIMETANSHVWLEPLRQARCPSQGNDGTTNTSAFGGSSRSAPEGNELRSHYYAVLGAKPKLDPATEDECPGTAPYGPLVGKCWGGIGSGMPGAYANNGVMYPESKIATRRITDGTSHTLLIGECSWDFGSARVWAVGSLYHPDKNNTIPHAWATYSGRNVAVPVNTATSARFEGAANDIACGSMHPGGTHFAMADGSSQFVSENVDMQTYKGLASRTAGELLGEY